MAIRPDTIYIFVKSGNRVRTVRPASAHSWEVVRVDGKSAGKGMICESRALKTEEAWARVCQTGNKKEGKR